MPEFVDVDHEIIGDGILQCLRSNPRGWQRLEAGCFGHPVLRLESDEMWVEVNIHNDQHCFRVNKIEGQPFLLSCSDELRQALLHEAQRITGEFRVRMEREKAITLERAFWSLSQTLSFSNALIWPTKKDNE